MALKCIRVNLKCERYATIEEILKILRRSNSINSVDGGSHSIADGFPATSEEFDGARENESRAAGPTERFTEPVARWSIGFDEEESLISLRRPGRPILPPRSRSRDALGVRGAPYGVENGDRGPHSALEDSIRSLTLAHNSTKSELP
jgi:hypothetical protein